MAASNPAKSIPRSILFQRRVLTGANANATIPARAVPPAADQGPNGFAGGLLLELVGAVVLTVSFVDPAVPPAIVTLLGVNVQLASAGSVPQVNFTVPV